MALRFVTALWIPAFAAMTRARNVWSHPISRKHRTWSIVRVRNAHPASYSIKGHGPEAALILALQACTARCRFQISSWRCAYARERLELERTEKQPVDRPSKISPSANSANVLGSGTPGVGSGGETSPASRLKRPALVLKSNGSPIAYGPRSNSHDVSERRVSFSFVQRLPNGQHRNFLRPRGRAGVEQS